MIYIGKYANTHGLKGEIRIISNFSRKDLIFVVGGKLFIDNNEYEITSYRIHKNYDMVTFKNINNINDIEHLKGKDVYANELNVDFLVEDLVSYKVVLDNIKMPIEEIIENKKYKILVLEDGKMVPFIDAFIQNIDSDNKTIYIREGLGL